MLCQHLYASVTFCSTGKLLKFSLGGVDINDKNLKLNKIDKIENTTANILPKNNKFGKFVYRLARVFAGQEKEAGCARVWREVN